MPRIPSLARLLALALLFAWPATSMPGEGLSKDAESLATRFVEAWNTHDAAAFGALMAGDADWVTASGIRLLGRDKIQAYLADEHATWAKTTTMRAMNVHVRSLSRDSAVVLFDWEMATPAEDGGASSVARGNNQFVAVRDGDWKIVSGQVARKR
jgi:uncharacterized protein (TIGR02246 family)